MAVAPKTLTLILGYLVLCSFVTLFSPALWAEEQLYVFDGVNVIDVETGEVANHQRLVIRGNRIQAIGSIDWFYPDSG